MRDMFMDALTVRSAPPRKPPQPPARPVKLGGNGEPPKDEKPASEPPAGDAWQDFPAPATSQPDPLDIPPALQRKPRSESPADQTAVRPSYADNIDRLVADLVASGAVVYDRETDSYRAPHYRAYRFGGDNA